MTSIPIDPEKGLDPHLCCCVHCGNDTNDLTVGALRKAQDNKDAWHYVPRGTTVKYNRELAQKSDRRIVTNWQSLEDYEKVPSGYCDDCEKEIKTMEACLQSGGVHFNCTQCSTTGMLTGTSEIAIQVRKYSEIVTPNPVGITFEKCAEHTPPNDNNNG